MAKVDFIKQLGEIKKNFLKHAKENSAKVSLKTFEINICSRYLAMRIECKDVDGNCIVFEQEIEMDNVGNTYQNPLLPSSIQEYY